MQFNSEQHANDIIIVVSTDRQLCVNNMIKIAAKLVVTCKVVILTIMIAPRVLII